jgi:hypothetical protein
MTLRTSPTTALLAVASVALAASASCTLDPTGALPVGGEGGAAASSGAGPTPASSGATTTASTSTSSSGAAGGDGGADGAGGGQGGAGATGGGGGGGGGGGAAGGGGAGGQGGGGPLDEWLVRVTGGDRQEVRDVAFDPVTGDLFVVGLVKGTTVAVDGLDGTSVAEGEDAFVARLGADGEPIWFQSFGGADNDSASAVAVAADGRVFVAGLAKGESADADDLFIPGVDVVPSSPWGWLAEISPSTGEVDAGVPFGPVDPQQPIDVTVADTVAVAVGTCTSGCEGDDLDLVVAGIVLATGDTTAATIVQPFDQRSGAVAAGPSGGTIAVAGRFQPPVFYAGGDGVSCPLTAAGGDDVFVATYTIDAAGFATCAWAKALGGTGSDRADAVHVDADGSVYVAARFSAFPLVPPNAASGPFAVKVTAAGAQWGTPLEPDGDGLALALASDGTDVLVGGQLGAGDDGYLVRLAADTGAEGGRRVLADSTSLVRGVAHRDGAWIAGGLLGDGTDVGGAIGVVEASGADGFVMRFATP